MVQPHEVSWASYKQYEGPFYRGKIPFVLSSAPPKEERILAVLTATEGGHYDAFNGYDVCGWTSGLAQWCEMAQYSVSDMLGEVANKDMFLLRPFVNMAVASGFQFSLNDKWRWRLFFNDNRGEIDRKQEQLQLFYKGGDGTKGSWTNEAVDYAKRWAAAISSVWEQPEAQRCQLRYTTMRLFGFAFGASRDVLVKAPDTELGEAFTAAYLSFAGNNPSRANKHLSIAMEKSRDKPYSLDWLVAVLRELTFGPNIAIYPHRYNAIRPVLEKLYGINLPDMAEDMRSWMGQEGLTTLPSTIELQMALIALNYDLGPRGADGRFGPKTRDAVLTFERLHQHPTPDGYPDPMTVRWIEEELEKQGRDRLLPS